MRWQRLTDVNEGGKSATLPHLKGLKNGDIATSRIKQVRWARCACCVGAVWAPPLSCWLPAMGAPAQKPNVHQSRLETIERWAVRHVQQLLRWAARQAQNC